MRKSYQSQRFSQAMRQDPDDPRASSSRQTLDARRGSSIPMPSRPPRSSSCENKMGRASVMQSAMRRSKSQVNMAAVTPMRPPPSMLIGSAGSQKYPSPYSESVHSSRKSTYSNIMSAKPARVVKDTRPLMDKSFQQQEIQKITSFFNSQPDVLGFAPKGINLRQPLTLKLFVELINYLFSFIDENVSVNMTNYVTEIPLIMKRWGYIGNVNASWLKTVNTQHALPHALGLLSCLVTIASAVINTDYEEVMKEAIHNDEDGADESFPYGNVSIYLDHLMKQYVYWSINDTDSEQKEEERFISELCVRNGLSDNDMSEIAESVRSLEKQLNDPKELAEIEAAEVEEKKYNSILNDYKSTVAFKTQMEEFLNTAETALEEEKQKLQREETVRSSLQEKIMNLKDQLSKQTMTVKERDELVKSCSELSCEIRINEEYVQEVLNQIYGVDLDMAKARSMLMQKTQAYNKVIVVESCWFPELVALKDETNPLHPSAKDELAQVDTEACKLKSDLQKKNEMLLSELKEKRAELCKVEERKSQLMAEVLQWSEKCKQQEQAEETLKTVKHEETAAMKKEINSLKAHNEAHLNNQTVEEAEAELKRMVEKVEHGRQHIKQLAVKAEKFFKESARITKSFMDTVLRAEEDYAKKYEEALEKTREKLSRNEHLDC